MLISEHYLEQQQEMHADTERPYGYVGNQWADTVMDLMDRMKTRDVLDYGCGKSTLSLCLPFAIKQYDPAIEKYSDPPEPADLVVCTDVLEHIERECLDDVLADLRRLSRRALFLSISLQPAEKTLPDGRNAHLIVEPMEWWLDRLIGTYTILTMQHQPGYEVSMLLMPRDAQ